MVTATRILPLRPVDTLLSNLVLSISIPLAIGFNLYTHFVLLGLFSAKMLPKQVFASLFFGLALCSPVQLRPRNADSPHAIPNRYIVVLKKGTSKSSFTDHINKVNRRNEEYALQKRETPADPADDLSIGPFKCYSIKCNNATMSEILSSPEVGSYRY